MAVKATQMCPVCEKSVKKDDIDKHLIRDHFTATLGWLRVEGK